MANLDKQIDPEWGLYPEDQINKYTNEASQDSIVLVINKISLLIENEILAILPEYRNFTYDEIITWIRFNSYWSGKDDMSTYHYIYPIIPVMISKLPSAEIGHLIQSTRIVRTVFQNSQRDDSIGCSNLPYAKQLDFALAVAEIYKESGIKPDYDLPMLSFGRLSV
jgi:hypothetical protein